MKSLAGGRYILILVLLFLLQACAAGPGNHKIVQHGLLWRIDSGQAISSSYILGTIHSDDKRVIQLREPIEKTFDQAKLFVLEVDLDKVSPELVSRYLYYQDERTLKAIAGESLYERSLRALMARGVPRERVNKMKPWAVFMVLNMPRNRSGDFLDALLFKRAKQKHKEIHGLETIEEQMNVFDQMALDTQIALLKVTLDNQADLDKLLDETVEIYLQKDLRKIEQLNTRYMRYLPPEVAKILMQRLLLDRNRRMVNRWLPLLKRGDAFVAVGALHLPGEQGILNLLAQQGYRLTPLD